MIFPFCILLLWAYFKVTCRTFLIPAASDFTHRYSLGTKSCSNLILQRMPSRASNTDTQDVKVSNPASETITVLITCLKEEWLLWLLICFEGPEWFCKRTNILIIKKYGLVLAWKLEQGARIWSKQICKRVTDSYYVEVGHRTWYPYQLGYSSALKHQNWHESLLVWVLHEEVWKRDC